jgi:glycosyltransferase involved in cell wall biosynthesis
VTSAAVTKIAIDVREACGHPTGVGRIILEVLREWATLPAARECEFILCATETPPVFNGLRAEVSVHAGHGVWWEQLVFPRLARRGGADVIFSPAYSGPLVTAIPLVVAIHDVSFAAHPEWYRSREGLRRRLLARAAAQKAARVITISEFSRREIVDHLGVTRNKVELVYPGVTLPRAPSALPASAVPAPLVLYVGSLFNRRHIPELMEGFDRLARRRREARLVIVGENRTFPPLDIDALRARTSQADRIELIPYVSDEALDTLYSQARAFVFLSDYEGFGLTPAEALARGVPIVVLDTPIAREIYGDAAIYVAQPDPALIAAALERALYDEDTRRAIISQANAVISQYTWRACAAGILDVLHQVGHGV